MPRKPRAPGYLLHKRSGQAVVVMRGKTVYLGPYGSPESRDAYHKAIVEFAVSPMALPGPQRTPETVGLTVIELAAGYLTWATGYYVKGGKATAQLHTIKGALRPLRRLYGEILAIDFGPKSLKAVREAMIAEGLARSSVNQRVGIIKRMFKWAASEELMGVSVFQALATVPGLRAGRSAARETAPIPPVDDRSIEMTLPHLPPVVADMIRVARWTGCRPTELCIMRPGDIDRSSDIWLYRPQAHKTEHHGKERIICIGPRAQEVLLSYLLRDSQEFCFKPKESETRRLAEMRQRRKTRVQPSQMNRRKPGRRRQLADRYDKDSLNHAIHRAVARANKLNPDDAIPQWSANQLRHARATEVRKEYGLEAAQVALGHSRADVTQIYAEKNVALAAVVAKNIG